MMCCGKSLLVAALTAVLLLHLGSRAEAASNFDCCLQYREGFIPPRHIVGFTQQLANEACDIDAIIFHTRKRFAICADPKKMWVKQTVQLLSKRVRKM